MFRSLFVAIFRDVYSEGYITQTTNNVQTHNIKSQICDSQIR